jgi:hypothetical protein
MHPRLIKILELQRHRLSAACNHRQDACGLLLVSGLSQPYLSKFPPLMFKPVSATSATSATVF